uniref:F-box domain-containing protein n=1 Tax=Globodera rostochiensis TaxID=31243 RepID=A0A914H2F3_GLORO
MPSTANTWKKRNQIKVSNDVWWNVFEWILRAELGLKMALLSARFDAIVDTFLREKRWSLGVLKIIRRTEDKAGEKKIAIACFDGAGNIFRTFPIAERPLPNGVTAFERILLSHVDNDVVEFLHHLEPLFIKKGINLTLNVCHWTSGLPNWPITAPEVWPLVVENTVRLRIHDEYGLIAQNHRISPDIIRQCANLRLIDSRDLFPEGPADDGTASSPAQALSQWLHLPRGDGWPKILLCEEVWPFGEKVEGLKKAFVEASSPVNFIVRLSLHHLEGGPFELRNERTGERLTMELIDDAGGEEVQQGIEEEDAFDDDEDDRMTHYIPVKHKLWLLRRCPIERPKDWVHWEKEAIGWSWDSASNVIEVDDEHLD